MLSRIRNYLFGKKISPVANKEISTDCSLEDAVLSGWFQEGTHELITDFKILPEHEVLDVGCGDGGLSNFCASQGAAVTFIDIDPDMIKHTEQRLKDSPARALKGIVSDANPLPLPNDHFDRVVCTEVIEHVDDPQTFMRELVRVGKPGALFLLSVPDPISETVQHQVAPALAFQKPYHINFFSRDDFSKLITDAGLEIEKQSFYGFYWSIFWSFFWICRQDLNGPTHPLIQNWQKTWSTLLSMEGGLEVKNALDQAMPKSQIIIAKKPK